MYNGNDLYISKIRKRLITIQAEVYSNATPVDSLEFFETADSLIIQEAMRSKRFKPCPLGTTWGEKKWNLAYFRICVSIPDEMKGKAVSLRFHSDISTSVIFLNGAPLQGLDENRDECRLTEKAKGGENYELFVEACVGNHQGKFHGASVVSRAEICVFNRTVWECWRAQDFLFQLAMQTPRDSPRFKQLLDALNDSVNAYDYEASLPEDLEIGAQAALDALAKVRADRAESSMPTAHLTAHAHIDVAWRWPIRETVRKCSRTFSTIMKYMEEYPEFHFVQSQALLYEFTKTHYPELYKKIKKRLKEGRWEAIGGMWVEPDSNLVSGESLIRQILYGQQYFEKEFGVRSETAWLPDMFGYTGALPQILLKSGFKNLASNKIAKSETNVFPYSTLNWRGIDGSEILTHFFPARSYDSKFTVKDFVDATRQFVESDRSDDFLFSFGYGDGGGGATKDMFENARIGADLEGLPRMRYTAVEDFFKLVRRNARDLPTWVGEIYFELHRGTYTSQAFTKKSNRRAEFLLRETEWLCSLGHLDGRPYPAQALEENWKIALLQQFHDILPGSSIPEVYEDSAKDYARFFAQVAPIRDGALDLIAGSIDTRGEGIPVVVFNSLSWERNDEVEIAIPSGAQVGGVLGRDGQSLPCETIGEGKNRRIRFEARNVPSMGYATFRLVEKAPESAKAKLSASVEKLENSRLRIRFDKDGLIRSIYDKQAKRELVQRGKRANVFQVYEDIPWRFDAWDLLPDYETKGYEATSLESIEVVSEGPLEAAVCIKRKFGKSFVEQIVALPADSNRVEFRTKVDWHENHKILKTSFPTSLHSGSPSRATYEIQYGHLERPTHWNTSWDRAKYEVCAHRWADLSEHGYGVALLNDCKYGYDIKDAQMRLTLLRSPKEPDPMADMGKHEFSYALMPHIGDLREAGVVEAGYQFNEPLRPIVAREHDGASPSCASFFSIDRPGVIVDCVKRAEEGDALIVRVYEAFGARAKATLTLPRPALSVAECDLMEAAPKSCAHQGQRFSFEIKPFEIKTFRVEM